MKRSLLLVFILCVFSLDSHLFAEGIYSGPQGSFHVQGIAYDREHQCMYMSFTTSLIKVDMHGRLLGSVQGLTGHLGCISLNPEDGKLYGSLEYKHDAIGKGIIRGTGAQNDARSEFYVAIFDVDRITEKDMDPAEVMKAVCLREVGDDFAATVTNQGREVEHRYGCSGIDGLTIAPQWGKKNGKMMLYTAYGVYGDKSRTDNDYQVIHCYDIARLNKYGQILTPANLHQSGPKKADKKYFVYTGNTEWGIQNLAYEPTSGHLFAAVYPGKKEGRKNFRMFIIDSDQKARKEVLKGVEPKTKGLVLSLLPCGTHDAQHDVWGWDFKYGSTGLCGIGDGKFYVSHNARKDGRESSTVYLYQWDPQNGMQRVEE